MAASTPKPDILLLHGGWHTAAHYTKITTPLTKLGFKVHIPPLPSMSGASPATADLSIDSNFVRKFANELIAAGTRLIVLMHSYGGQVGTNALYGLSAAEREKQGKIGGVVALVYMAAFAMRPGTSMTAWVHAQGHKDLMPLAFDFNDETGIVTSRHPAMLVVGEGLLPEAEMAEYVNGLTTWASKCWTDELEHCAWRDQGLAVTYIQAPEDKTIPLDYQKKFVEGIEDAGVKVNTVVVDTGHCPNVTAPNEIVKVLEQVAASA